jgi:hypothetical protein
MGVSHVSSPVGVRQLEFLGPELHLGPSKTLCSEPKAMVNKLASARFPQPTVSVFILSLSSQALLNGSQEAPGGRQLP